MKITAQNINDFPIGTKVRFNYGSMNGSEDGLVVDHGSDRFYPAFLIAETEEGKLKHIHNFTDRGIGCYLVA